MIETRPIPAGKAVPACPCCGGQELKPFYRVERAPVHSVLLMKTPEVAREFPKGNISLRLCPGCGFISNTEFDPSRHTYSAEYEETQSYSPTFRAFHEKLAGHLIRRYDLRRKTVIEIGCGKGEFLSLLCRMGENRGIGIDPAFVADRNPASGCDVEFVADFYSEKYGDCGADAVICKMTLEHIPNTYDFVSLIYKSISARPETIVFFQVPDVRRILCDAAFEDIYYEHCSYFTAGSLRRLFTRSGFEVVELNTEYGGQYLTVVARPGNCASHSNFHGAADIRELENQTGDFSTRAALAITGWRRRITSAASAGKRVALWGSGSKGVAFLTAMAEDAEHIAYVVDINPYRQGKYMAGTGHRIVEPEHLLTEKADVVIAMNSIYRDEIGRDLDRMGLCAELMTL